jgi:ribonuclease H / adenosylcobalamin/alpha-ribazole phosphatase
MDSKLVIEQLSLRWKIKEEHLKKFAREIRELIQSTNLKIEYQWIPRERNKIADELSNKAMDEYSRKT